MGNETEISGRLLNTSFQTLKHMEHQVHGVLKLIQFDGLLVKSCRVSALKVGQITQKTHSLGKTTILFHYTCIARSNQKNEKLQRPTLLGLHLMKTFPKVRPVLR